MNCKKIIYILLFLLSFTIPKEASAKNIIIVRHGESEHNVLDIYNSNPRHPQYQPSHLTPEGIRKTIETSHQLIDQGFNPSTIDAVYVSPLPRTQETAHILAREGLFSIENIIVDARLLELQVGDLEGKPIIRPWDNSLGDKYHTEPDQMIRKRLKNFIECIQHDAHSKNIVIVTHGVIAQRLMMMMDIKDAKRLDPGESFILDPQPETVIR